MNQPLPDNLSTKEVIERIFRDPTVEHGLAEFEDLGKKPHEVLSIFPKAIGARGEVRYYLRCFKRNIDLQVLSDRRSSPEEIVRQLWLYKLHEIYGYPFDHIEVEYQVS